MLVPDNGATNRVLRCVMPLDQPPGCQFENVRKPISGLRGWLARAEEKLTHRILPETQLSSHIRGNKVAQDNLLEALLEHSQLAHFSFVVEQSRQKQFEQWATNRSGRHHSSPIEIHAAAGLFRHGLDKIAPDIWLDFFGSPEQGPRIRDNLSRQLYPTISVQHGLSIHSYLYDRFLRMMLTPSYPCDSLICTSKACKRGVSTILAEVSSRFNEQFGAKVRYDGRLDQIPLCVNTDKLQPRDKASLRRQLGIRKDAVILLYVGYLSQIKADLIPLLPMIRRLVDEDTGVLIQFIIAGTGPESYCNSLRTMVQDLNLVKNITLMREVPDTVKEQLLGAADIFVAPCDSMQESFGLTPVEAMACGLPQVVADWDGYRDTVLDGETGFLVPTCWGCCDKEFVGTANIFGWAYDHALLSQSVSLDVEIVPGLVDLRGSRLAARYATWDC